MTRWNADRIVSVSAIIVSVGTLIMIIYQTNLVREEQKASVMPYLVIGMSNGVEDGLPYQQLFIHNQGLGPAKIEKLEVITEDKVLEVDPLQFLASVNKDSLLDKIYYVDLVSSGRLIGADERVVIIRVANDQNQDILVRNFKFPDHYNVFLKNPQRGEATFQITYSSLYGDRWVTRSNANQPEVVK